VAEAANAPGVPAVTDRRPVPRGVLPRGTQTWLMVGIAGVMVLIMFVAGRPRDVGPRAPVTTVPSAPSPDRLRDYQDRLRVMEARAAQDTQPKTNPPVAPPEAVSPEPPHSSNRESLVAERRRRDYESLFASNLVFSRRPEAERLDSRGQGLAALPSTPVTSSPRPVVPSVDEVADAVVRASTRAAGATAMTGTAVATETPRTATKARDTVEPLPHATQTGPISPDGPLHRLLEGTVIDTVLTNRLDGGSAAPVNCLVTNPVYSHSGHAIVIPSGARILGETKPVQALGELRLAVAFHRLVMPDGSTHSLDHPPGLNQIGDAGLRDRVNQHYWSTFGAAAAVGLISGFAQFVGTSGLSNGGGDRTVIIAGGAADASAQAGMQVMNRFLNRLPTITIREGHRVKVYLISDLELPVFNPSAGS
jgi:type IV secretory pathway VirB10-like protein